MNPLVGKIKAYRAATGCGLKEAHDAIMAGRDVPSPENAEAERSALDRIHDERISLRNRVTQLEAIALAAEELAQAASEAIAWVEQALEGDEDVNPDYEIVTAGNKALAALRKAMEAAE